MVEFVVCFCVSQW